MYKKLYGLSIFAVTFALVLGFGAINQTLAASGSYNHDYGQADLIGVDEATNGVNTVLDRDTGPAPMVERTMSDNYNLDYGRTNLFAMDEARNSAGGLSDRDVNDNFQFPKHGER